MLEVLKKLLQQLTELHKNNHPSRILELLHGIYNKISVFYRIFFFLSIGKLALSSFMGHFIKGTN